MNLAKVLVCPLVALAICLCSAQSPVSNKQKAASGHKAADPAGDPNKPSPPSIFYAQVNPAEPAPAAKPADDPYERDVAYATVVIAIATIAQIGIVVFTLKKTKESIAVANRAATAAESAATAAVQDAQIGREQADIARQSMIHGARAYLKISQEDPSGYASQLTSVAIENIGKTQAYVTEVIAELVLSEEMPPPLAARGSHMEVCVMPGTFVRRNVKLEKERYVLPGPLENVMVKVPGVVYFLVLVAYRDVFEVEHTARFGSVYEEPGHATGYWKLIEEPGYNDAD